MNAALNDWSQLKKFWVIIRHILLLFHVNEEEIYRNLTSSQGTLFTTTLTQKSFHPWPPRYSAEVSWKSIHNLLQWLMMDNSLLCSLMMVLSLVFWDRWFLRIISTGGIYWAVVLDFKKIFRWFMLTNQITTTHDSCFQISSYYVILLSAWLSEKLF